ncbi:MAG: GNAT family N-acetyltransferase [Solirubrobacteraceae bacterium]
MRPDRFESQTPTNLKIELVLRSLGGEPLAELARETGRPKRQLSAWRRRFLAGGEAQLKGDEPHEIGALPGERSELSAKIAELETDNRMLARRLALLGPDRVSPCAPRPYCSELYSSALEEPGVARLHLPEWGTYVLVRDGRGRPRHATGARPLASLDPHCDVGAGLDALRQAGIASVSLVTDPLWCPDASALDHAFATCRVFKEYYLVDREDDVHIRKRHRNRINQALRVGVVEEISLADHLQTWIELYRRNVASRQIAQPFSPAYFERLAHMEGLRTIAVLVKGEIVTMTLWIQHGDSLYFHDGASSVTGHEISAAYAAFAHAIASTAQCRYVLLGGSQGFHDERLDGLAVFKRGFSNASLVSYLCSAKLSDRA